MKCPVDGTALLMTERQGVEIDYCPTCRGVWLDRGELDKIIEKATPAVVLPDPDPEPLPSAPPAPAPEPVRMERPKEAAHRSHSKKSKKDRYRDDRYKDDDDDYRHARRYKKKKQKSVLSEIFDFFD